MEINKVVALDYAVSRFNQRIDNVNVGIPFEKLSNVQILWKTDLGLITTSFIEINTDNLPVQKFVYRTGFSSFEAQSPTDLPKSFQAINDEIINQFSSGNLSKVRNYQSRPELLLQMLIDVVTSALADSPDVPEYGFALDVHGYKSDLALSSATYDSLGKVAPITLISKN